MVMYPFIVGSNSKRIYQTQCKEIDNFLYPVKKVYVALPFWLDLRFVFGNFLLTQLVNGKVPLKSMASPPHL